MISIESDFTITNFQFDKGGVLPELRLHYRTLGTPQFDADGRATNAVLIMHGTSGSGAAFLREQFAGVLFGKGQLLDTERYFIILPDAIGHGGSSKPSDGLRAAFPEYGYNDMVRACHQLVTEGLSINHLRLVTGTSMGGMHSWVWGYTYPTMMDALMPMASLPGPIAGRNRMVRRMIIDGIRNDPEWQNGNYTSQPRGLITACYAMLFMTSIPLQMRKEAPTLAEADALFDKKISEYLARFDANDLLYQVGASWDYDPSPHLEQIVAPLLAINSADDQVNPPELRVMENNIGRVANGEFVLIPISDATRGHGSHSWPVLWQDDLRRLLARSQPN